MFLNLGILVVCCLVINYASDKLGDNIGALGHKLKINSSVRGAVFDGISSSVPEFLTALVASLCVLGIIGEPDPSAFADVGVGAIGGSAIFNILVIPFVSLFVTSKEKLATIEINKEFMMRDIGFYFSSIGMLLAGSYVGSLNRPLGIGMTLLYVAYLFKLKADNKNSEDEDFEEVEESVCKLVTSGLLWLIPIGIAVHFCVVSAEQIGTMLNIPRIIMSLIVLASVTSLPDTLLSVKSAKNGDIDGAISNAIGSNCFDILICLGLILAITGINVTVVFSEVSYIFAFLLLSSVSYTIAFYFNMSKTYKLLLLGIPYVMFIGYLIKLI